MYISDLLILYCIYFSFIYNFIIIILYLINAGKNKYRPRSSRRNENNNIQYTIRESNYPKCTRKEYTIGEVASIKISNKKDSASSSFSSNHANESKPWRQPNGPTQSKGFTNKRLLYKYIYICIHIIINIIVVY